MMSMLWLYTVLEIFSLNAWTGIILGTHREKGAYTFWSYAVGLPLPSSAILSWKFFHVLHKILRDGHRNVSMLPFEFWNYLSQSIFLLYMYVSLSLSLSLSFLLTVSACFRDLVQNTVLTVIWFRFFMTTKYKMNILFSPRISNLLNSRLLLFKLLLNLNLA